MLHCYHGSSALFDHFDLDHALEGDGKVKFGYGVYLSDRRLSALTYAGKSKAGKGCYIYTVGIPELTDDNHIVFGEAVRNAIIEKAEAKLEVRIPCAVLFDGKLFRKFIASHFCGCKRPTLEGEKAASAFLDGIGVYYAIYPVNWKSKDADGCFSPPFNYVVFNPDRIRIVSVETIEPQPSVIAVRKVHVSDMIREHYPQYYSIEKYPVEQVAAFCKLDAQWGIFSNFAHTPLIVDGLEYKSAEHLFQTMKFIDTYKRKKVYEYKGNPKMIAKHMEKLGFRRPDWGAMIVDAMKFCIRQKYEQCPKFREALERSKGLYIVEDQTSSQHKTADTWGAKLSPDGKRFIGPNLMGRLLMELRDTPKPKR